MTTQAGRARGRKPGRSALRGRAAHGTPAQATGRPKRLRWIAAHAEDGSPATKFAARMVAGQPRMGHERAKRRRQGNREEGWNCAAGPARPPAYGTMGKKGGPPLRQAASWRGNRATCRSDMRRRRCPHRCRGRPAGWAACREGRLRTCTVGRALQAARAGARAGWITPRR